LLLHLAATETYYQMNTFEKIKWDSWPDAVKQKWDPAMNLGDAGRKTLEGNELGYYLDALRETREKSLAEFRKRDDAWLMAVDQTWPWGTHKQLLQVVSGLRARIAPRWTGRYAEETASRGQARRLIVFMPGKRKQN
jgi:hypothetical protein